MNNKDKYIALCKKEKNIPVFLQYWWLDAVCGKDNWDVVLIEKGGLIWGALPYYYFKTCIGLILGMPKLTQFIGLWIRYPNGQKYTSKLSHEKEIIQGLISKLPKFALFKQNFHYALTNWLPFYWKDFKQTTKYTYVIPSGLSEKVIWENLDKQTRSDIRNAKEKLKIREITSLRVFYNINKQTFTRKGVRIPYTYKLLRTIDNAVKDNNSGKIFVAEDGKGNLHASCYLIWDEREIYYLAGGIDHNHKNSGAMSLLIWRGINMALEQDKSFNFEGSMLEPVEKYFRGFGALQKRYFKIWKANSLILKFKYFIENI